MNPRKTAKADEVVQSPNGYEKPKKLPKEFYQKELERLQFEMVKLQYWAKETGQRIVLIFEGRDAAGKGGVIQRLTEPLNPRGIRIVALSKPSDVERTQWYFQRYVAHLPAAGEIVIFDRSWYNRAGVERVMGFCTEDEYRDFLNACPTFERMLVNSGIHLVKHWLSVSDDEQEKRFQARAKDPTKRWKLSPIDLTSREHWVDYSKAKDVMMQYTDIVEAPWYQVHSDNKMRARLNTIHHLLTLFPYTDMLPKTVKLKKRAIDDKHYHRPPMDAHPIVTDYYEDITDID